MEPALVFALILRRYGPVGQVVVPYHPYLFVGFLRISLLIIRPTCDALMPSRNEYME